MATFSERLRLLRKEKGLNQTQLADELNVTIGTVSVWERGVRKPEVDTLERICRYFDVSLGYLLGSIDIRQLPEEQETGVWSPENDHDVMLKYMIRYSQLSEESKEAIKIVIDTMYRSDQIRGVLVEPDGGLDQQLEKLIVLR